MERDLFLRKYRIEQEDFDAAGVSWEELTAIADHYATIEGKLREIGKDFVDKYLYDIEKAGIHSYRYRTKAPGHLLEKIIRKKKEQPEKFAQLGVDNYWKYVTDLIGIRVFFLYREDWIYFHKYITTVFENDPSIYVKDRGRDFDEDPSHCYIAERPKVYRRNGDTRIYDEKLIDIKSDGIYRSLHYIIKYKGYYVEIQGRTLFEEGWSEIDHDIVYPYYQDDEMLSDFSTLLNRLAGMADEMSSYFRRIKQQYFREQLAPLGFQPMDGMILYLLWGGNCLRQEDIAAQTALDKGAVARSVARLEERGLVERWVSDQCRREKQVSLTPAGEERAGAVQKILESWNDICCRGFSSEERTLYNSFLSRIIENVMQYKRGEEGDDG